MVEPESMASTTLCVDGSITASPFTVGNQSRPSVARHPAHEIHPSVSFVGIPSATVNSTPSPSFLTERSRVTACA
mgnify:CR=1 FL=1